MGAALFSAKGNLVVVTCPEGTSLGSHFFGGRLDSNARTACFFTPDFKAFENELVGRPWPCAAWRRMTRRDLYVLHLSRNRQCETCGGLKKLRGLVKKAEGSVRLIGDGRWGVLGPARLLLFARAAR